MNEQTVAFTQLANDASDAQVRIRVGRRHHTHAVLRPEGKELALDVADGKDVSDTTEKGVRLLTQYGTAEVFVAEGKQADSYVYSEGFIPGILPREALPIFDAGLSIPVGLTVLMGTAGTGKSTALANIAKALQDKAEVTMITVSEPSVDSVNPDIAFEYLLRAAARTMKSSKPTVILLDSLRFLSITGSGYPERLAAGAMDLSLLAALTDLDVLAKRLNVHVIASLFFNLYQVTRGDAANEQSIVNGLRTFAIDVDGSVEQTILMGPTRREAGHFESWSRRHREGTITGQMPLTIAASAPQGLHQSPVEATPSVIEAPAIEPSRFVQETAPRRGVRIRMTQPAASGTWTQRQRDIVDADRQVRRDAQAIMHALSEDNGSGKPTQGSDATADAVQEEIREASSFFRGLPPELKKQLDSVVTED